MCMINWNEVAMDAAKEAHEERFERRRGAWYHEDLEVVVLFNNNPYVLHPESRDKEVALFRAWLREVEFEELGFAKYPVQTGYSYAMVIRATKDDKELLEDVMLAITIDCFPATQSQATA